MMTQIYNSAKTLPFEKSGIKNEKIIKKNNVKKLLQKSIQSFFLSVREDSVKSSSLPM